MVIVVIMVIVIAMIMQVQNGEDIAGIHAEGAHLETGADAQHKQPYGNTPYQRRRPSTQNPMNSRKNPRGGLTRQFT